MSSAASPAQGSLTKLQLGSNQVKITLNINFINSIHIFLSG